MESQVFDDLAEGVVRVYLLVGEEHAAGAPFDERRCPANDGVAFLRLGRNKN